MSSNRLTLVDALNNLIKSNINKIHTCMPGTIELYDPMKKKASVKPSIKRNLDNEIVSYPVITDVPVIMPGTNTSIISFPINKGDGCLILFSEVSLERYLSSAGKEVDPDDNRKFALADAMCIPGLFPFNNVGVTGDGISLQIKFKGYEIIINDFGITLKSTDALAWQPNILSNDPITGVPHGGITAGIIKLKGA